MEINRVLGILGIVLAIIEIWHPKLSIKLEGYITQQIIEIEQFQTCYHKEFRTLAKVANGSVKDVFKGPQLLTPEELHTIFLKFIINIKAYSWFYCATPMNFFILKPIRSLLVFLNKIGNGRAVGGLGVIIAVLSTFL